MSELIKALVKASVRFDEPKRTKKGVHNVMYAPMDEVLRATKKPLLDNGLFVSQHVISEGEMIGIETVVTHESGESTSSKFFARPVKLDPQSIGAFITYMRRYAYLAVLGLAPEDDDAVSAMPKKDPTPNMKKFYHDLLTKYYNGNIPAKDIEDAKKMSFDEMASAIEEIKTEIQ